MNRFILLYFVTVCLSLMIMGCERDDDCKEVITVPHMYFDDFGGTNDCGLNFTMADADSNYLINNEEYYEELIDCQDSILDFTKYVLLAGSKQFDTTVVKTNQAAIRNCKDLTFTYRISFEVTDTVDTRFHQYHAIVPKIPDDYQVGISRKTGYKWLARYQAHGLTGMHERSRRPHRSPTRLPAEVVALLLRERQRHASWGPNVDARLIV